MNTDLIKIEYPSEAYAGDTVEILVYIKNQTSLTIGIKPRAIVNDTIEVVFTVPYSNVPAGYTYYFTGHFIMPNANANIRAESYYYGVDGQWHFEDYQTRTVKLATLPEPPPSDIKDFDVQVPSGTYELERSVPYTGLYKYKGKAQGGYLTIELGTGVYPLFFTKHTFAQKRVTFTEAMDWASGSLSGSFTLPPTLKVEQTYNVRARLETDDGAQETDTDWGVFSAILPPSVWKEFLKVEAIQVPQSAKAGELVTVKVTLCNVCVYSFAATPTAAVNLTYLYFGSKWIILGPSETFTWSDTFTMPDHDVLVHAEAWYESAVHENDSKDATVLLEVVPEVETLEVDITPVGTGYVTTVPASEEGKTTWQNGETGTFPYGTSVQVTAHPGTGYRFEKWSDEIIGGVSYDNPSYVQDMTEHRAVKAHFRAEDEPEVETLEVDITPVGKGYVETEPDPEAGYQKWVNGSTGEFPYGTKVRVTAYPYTGYRFEKWSDEIIGGVSYQNPEYVQDMTEHRAVKAHFREEEEEPTPGKGELTAIVIHWQEYTDLIPPAEIENRGTYEIHPVAVNVGTEAIQFRVKAVVTKPSGAVIEVIDIDGWPYTGAGKEFKPTLNMGDVDEIGTWTAVINLYDHKTEELLDSWSGDLLIVSEAPPGMMEVLGPLLVLGLMAGVIMPMMKEGE